MEMERQKGMIEFRTKPEFGKNEFCERDDDDIECQGTRQKIETKKSAPE